MQSLFGGGSKTTKPVDLQSQQGKALRDDFTATLSQIFGPAGTGIPNAAAVAGAAPGPTTPMTAQETALLAQLGPTEGAERQALINQTLQGQFLNANPHLQAAIEAAQRPTMEALQHSIGRVIPGAFARAGHQFGGSFTNATSSTAADLQRIRASEIGARALGDIATQMSFGSFEAERARQQNAITLSGDEVRRTAEKLQASALPRMIEELGIERAMKAFPEQMAQWLEMLKIIFGTQAPVVASQSKETTERGIVPALFGQGVFAPR